MESLLEALSLDTSLSQQWGVPYAYLPLIQQMFEFEEVGNGLVVSTYYAKGMRVPTGSVDLNVRVLENRVEQILLSYLKKTGSSGEVPFGWKEIPQGQDFLWEGPGIYILWSPKKVPVKVRLGVPHQMWKGLSQFYSHFGSH